jgi:hypothetical protein
MPELENLYDYMRAWSTALGERILQDYPALLQVEDPIAPRIGELRRKLFPAQTIAIMGLVKRWQQARTAMVVAECGTGKTLISLKGYSAIGYTIEEEAVAASSSAGSADLSG